MISKTIRLALVVALSCVCGMSLRGAEASKIEKRHFIYQGAQGGSSILVASADAQGFFEIIASKTSADSNRYSARKKLGSVGPISCDAEQCSPQSYCDYTRPGKNSCPSYMITTAGYSFEDYGRRPGWNFHISNGTDFRNSAFSFQL